MTKQKSYKYLWVCICVVLGLLCVSFSLNMRVYAEGEVGNQEVDVVDDEAREKTEASDNEDKVLIKGDEGKDNVEDVIPLQVGAIDSNLSGSGTSGDPYLISNYAGLKEFAAIVNGDHKIIRQNSAACAQLTSDISCTDNEWIPIGKKKDKKYTGIFDGQNKKIYKLNNTKISTQYEGLFGYVGKDGTVKNVIIESGTIDGGTYHIGGIAGWNEGTIDNCVNKANVGSEKSKQERFGGIVGYNAGGTVKNCYNTGRVYGKTSYKYHDATGGVVGYNEGTVIGCYNTGEVYVEGKYSVKVGGVVGYNDKGSTVQHCYNTGNVQADVKSQAVYDIGVGGVVGRNHGTVTYCYNTGEVCDTISSLLSIGGVVGDHEKGTVSHCYNTGSVVGNKKHTGGVIGYSSGGVVNCYNIGGVRAKEGNIGGVVGYNGYKVESCYNAGAVIKSGNTSSITGDSKGVGGVIGRNSFAAAAMYCYYDVQTCKAEKPIATEGASLIVVVAGHTTAKITGSGVLGKDNGYLGFSRKVWMEKENDESYMYYPHLRGFAYDQTGKLEDWPPKLKKYDSSTGYQTTDPDQKSTDENINTDTVDPSLNGESKNNETSSLYSDGTSYTNDSHTYKTADTVTASGLMELELLMMLALVGLYFSLGRKRV